MSYVDKRPGSSPVVYSLKMSDGESAQITIYSQNPTEKVAYLENFLGGRDFFVADDTEIMYNKSHIVSCKEVK